MSERIEEPGRISVAACCSGGECDEASQLARRAVEAFEAGNDRKVWGRSDCAGACVPPD